MEGQVSQGSVVTSRTVLQRCLQRFRAYIKQQRVCSEIDCFDAGPGECEDRCTMCLEQFKNGQRLARLSCGHIFHCGSRETFETKILGPITGCTGILQWIGKTHSCPNCRTQMKSLTSRITGDIKRAEPEWQRHFVGSSLRREVFEDIATICVDAVKSYDLNVVMNLQIEEMRKYNIKTASRIEMALFSQSSSYDTYSDRSTLKYRTLSEIESMLDQRLQDMNSLKQRKLKET